VAPRLAEEGGEVEGRPALAFSRWPLSRLPYETAPHPPAGTFSPF